MRATAILKELTNYMSVSEAPQNTKRYGDWVEMICAIGKDETAQITMTKEAYDLLCNGEFGEAWEDVK